MYQQYHRLMVYQHPQLKIVFSPQATRTLKDSHVVANTHYPRNDLIPYYQLFHLMLIISFTINKLSHADQNMAYKNQ